MLVRTEDNTVGLAQLTSGKVWIYINYIDTQINSGEFVVKLIDTDRGITKYTILTNNRDLKLSGLLSDTNYKLTVTLHNFKATQSNPNNSIIFEKELVFKTKELGVITYRSVSDVTESIAVLRINNPDGLTAIQFVYSDNDNFDNPVVVPSIAPSTTRVIYDLNPDTEYRFKARSGVLQGGVIKWSEYSAPYRFKTKKVKKDIKLNILVSEPDTTLSSFLQKTGLESVIGFRGTDHIISANLHGEEEALEFNDLNIVRVSSLKNVANLKTLKFRGNLIPEIDLYEFQSPLLQHFEILDNPNLISMVLHGTPDLLSAKIDATSLDSIGGVGELPLLNSLTFKNFSMYNNTAMFEIGNEVPETGGVLTLINPVQTYIGSSFEAALNQRNWILNEE